MKPMIWQYQDDKKQRVCFRGRVREYRGALYYDHPCDKVRSNRAEAMKDAKALLKTLKTGEKGVAK